jgi:hypothetical protein
MPNQPDASDGPHFELHLQDIRDLFVAPDDDPFDPHYQDVSGIDELVNLITPTKLREMPRITVYLPPEKLTPTLQSETRVALHRILERRARWSQNEVLATRKGGWIALVYAFILSLIVLMLLGAAYYFSWPLWAQAVSYAIFIVVAWVSMWWAVETLLFDWLADRRLSRVYALIDAANMEIRAEPAATLDAVDVAS